MLRKSAIFFAAMAFAWVLGKSAAWMLMAQKTEVGGASQRASRMTVLWRERDLGTVQQGKVVRVAFPISNQGARRLVLIDRGKACCGQAVPPRQLIVPPGESLDVVVEVNTSQWFGRMCHVAEYESNDPRTPRLTLTIKALVEAAATDATSAGVAPAPVASEYVSGE